MNDCIVYMTGADGELHELTFLDEVPTEDISCSEEESAENFSLAEEKVKIEISGRLCGDVEEIVKFITSKKHRRLQKSSDTCRHVRPAALQEKRRKGQLHNKLFTGNQTGRGSCKTHRKYC